MNKLSLFATMLASACLLSACGGGHSSSSIGSIGAVSVPGVPQNLDANIGSSALSLGWDAPASGGAVQSYSLQVTPSVSAANIIISGTHAVLSNLTNNGSYTITVKAHNSAGDSAASTSIIATPRAVDVANYTPITIQNDTSPSGIFDPSIIHLSTGDLWMSYSSVNYYNNGSNQLVQDVGINLAKSLDGGATFTYAATIASPIATTVTDTSQAACGASTCTGRWVYETSWLVDDSTDPNPAQRYKLFAHKYFLLPGGTPATTLYQLGAIVMWTASSPDGTWSQETKLLGWNLTPVELKPVRVTINSLHADLAPCIAIAEGGATVRGGNIDFVFTCIYPGANPLPQKIVMLRTTDHTQSFQYVSTLLMPSDAAPINASFFTAPSVLATADNRSVLIVTPAPQGIYQGCVVIPFADDVAGTLVRNNGLPVGISYAPPITGHFGGACAYDRGLGANGMLLNDAVLAPGAMPVQRFQILETHTTL